MLADGSTNMCALTPVIALLVVCCFPVGRMLLSCLVPTLTGLTLVGVSVVVLHAIKRRKLAIQTVQTNLNGPLPMYPGVYGHFPVRRWFSPPAPTK